MKTFETIVSFKTLDICFAFLSVKWDTIFDCSSDGPFNVQTNLNRNVSLLRLFPGITYLTMRQFLEPPIQGVVLQTYGAGNLPTNRPDLIEELRKSVERGVLIVNCTQCSKGSVSYVYESATELQKIGVCSGSDMTIEAALMKVIDRFEFRLQINLSFSIDIKLSYVLGKYATDMKTMKMKMDECLRGEMSSNLSKTRCPTINLHWILNASKDETNEVLIYFLTNLHDRSFFLKGFASISSFIITLDYYNMHSNR